MTFLAQVALALLILTHTNPLAPAWESSLFSQIKPAATIALPAAGTVAQPIKTGTAGFSLGAISSLAIDADSGSVLYSNNVDQVLPIASITKLATVAVILRDHQLGDEVTVPSLPSYPAGAVTVPLRAGQKFQLSELLKAALIPSANDAADALAIWDSGSISSFVAKSNQLLSQWGINDITIADSSGLNAGSKASARALSKIGRLVLLNPELAADVKSAQVTIKDNAGQSYHLTSTNLLLGDSRFIGLKTGHTAEAGENLVAMASLGGHKVITVVLHSPDRFAETKSLVDFIQANWSWQ